MTHDAGGARARKRPSVGGLRDRCKECGQAIPLPLKPARVCFQCKRQIKRHDKWVFEGSRIRHRHCDNPTWYTPKDTK